MRAVLQTFMTLFTFLSDSNFKPTQSTTPQTEDGKPVVVPSEGKEHYGRIDRTYFIDELLTTDSEEISRKQILYKKLEQKKISCHLGIAL